MSGAVMRVGAALVVVLTTVFVATSQSKATTKIDDPEKFVRGVYAQIEKQPDKTREPEDIYSQRLSDLFALDSKEAGGEVGRIDFDPWTNSQDSEIHNVHVSSKPVESAPSRRTVRATFKNLGRSEDIRFYFEQTKKGWKLDDMRSVGKDSWTLSLILKYGWDDEK